MTDANRIVIVGGGHNGLVCAAYLARAGRKVLVLEANEQFGGAAVTREFHPGFKVSAVAHLLHLLDPRIARELDLAKHGLTMARENLQSVALSEAGAPLVLSRLGLVAGELSAHDQTALAAWLTRMRRFAGVLANQHGRIPPRLAWHGWREALEGAKFALDIRKLGRRDMAEFLRVATMNVYDVLEEEFDSEQLKGALALDGVLGTKLGPRSGGTLFALLHRMSAASAGKAAANAGGGPGVGWSLPRGGMGAVTAALAAAARAAGAELRSGARVSAILTQGDRISGVRLASGEQIAASTVVSNADPKATLLGLLGARHLETEFARRVRHTRALGTAAKLHLALGALPEFRGVGAAQIGERLLIAPSQQYIETAFNPAKYREYSPAPVMEISIPTVHDATLAPAGQHVLSATVQYAPYDVAGGWDLHRERFLEQTLAVLERYSPGLRSRLLGAQLLTPVDIEREFHLTGGHWHQGELALDQMLMLRPVPGAAQYAMPVNGLYLCGAGAHPGGGVMGSAGRNAARAVLEAPAASTAAPGAKVPA